MAGFPRLELLNLNFLTQSEACLVDILILGQTFTSGHLIYRAIQLRDTVSPVLSFGLLAWHSNMAAYQQYIVSKAHLLEFYGIHHLRD